MIIKAPASIAFAAVVVRRPVDAGRSGKTRGSVSCGRERRDGRTRCRALGRHSRGISRGFARSRGDRLPASELCRQPDPPLSSRAICCMDTAAATTPLAERLAKLAESADRLAAAQGFSELIVVTPNAFTLHKGSMYSKSVTVGDWESFVAQDLVAFIDEHYPHDRRPHESRSGGPLRWAGTARFESA